MTRANKGPGQRKTGDPRWRSLLWPAVGTVVFVLLVWVILAGTLGEEQGGVPEGTEVIPTGEPVHVAEDIYGPDEVPAGGPHAPIWANCGFYDQPIEAENAVHSLEHGAVWITYRPDIAESEIAALRDLTSPRAKILISPVLQEDPLMATAWGHQLTLASTEDPRLRQFLAEFAGSLSAPEPGGSCSGGVGAPSN